jgi:hypothetical protein
MGSPEPHEFMSDPKDDSLGLPRPSPKVFLPPSPTVDEPTSPAPATPDPLASSLPVNDANLAGTSADAKGLNSISDEAAIKDDLKTPKETHTWFMKLIEKNLKELRKPKTMISDKIAAVKIFDLEALKKFSEIRLRHSLKIQAMHKKLM